MLDAHQSDRLSEFETIWKSDRLSEFETIWNSAYEELYGQLCDFEEISDDFFEESACMKPEIPILAPVLESEEINPWEEK